MTPASIRHTLTAIAASVAIAASLFAADPVAPAAPEPGAGSTRGIIDFKVPADAVLLVGPDKHLMIPESEVKCQWTFADGILTASPQWDSVITPEAYQDFRLHVEFNVNDRPGVDPERNGNSGVYIQQRYEVQILNSYGVALEDYKFSYAGSIYRRKMPDKLVSKPAGEWQTYDIVFRAARYDGDKKTENARITVYQNNELIHDDYSLPRQTGAGKKEGPEPGPIMLQGHQNEVRFRNVWIQRLNLGRPLPAAPAAQGADAGKTPPAALESPNKSAAPAPIPALPATAPAVPPAPSALPVPTPAVSEQPKKKGYTYVIPFEKIPPAPALKPEDGLKTFKLHEAFAINVAVADPDVQSPVAVQFDADGRMWVVEMRAYMLDANGTGEDQPIGRISIHEDTDGDGTYETSSVFLDGLNQPRSIAFYKNGILYGGHDKLYFVENNDGKAGKMTVIDEKYAQDGNVEHRSNGLLRALDNWIYNVKSDVRYRQVNGGWVKEKTHFRGQWGMSQDNYGRLHYNENWFGMRVDQLLPNLLTRNKNFLKETSDTTALSFRDKLYPARVTPGVNRGGEGDIDENGYLKACTAACGPLLYRGDQFPAEFHNTAFFCEPAANLVRMIHVSNDDGTYSGEHLLGEREFLASTDERFRPVNIQTAPDGTIVVVDLYHGILQHKGYLTPYLREHIAHRNLESSPQLGRIYRIRHTASPVPIAPRLQSRTPAELVPFLSHANGWCRDTAQQRLVDAGDQSVVPLLMNTVADTTAPLGQLHALWTLEGLGAVSPEAVSAGLKAADPYVVEAAIRLAELLPAAEAGNFMPALAQVANRPEKVVRRQLAASLGRIQSPDALPLLKQVLLANLDVSFVRELAINGLEGQERAFQAILGDDLKDAGFKAYLEHALAIKTTAGAFKPPRDAAHLESYQRGEQFYVATCMACHHANGGGMEMLGPPLVGSEWVTGSDKRLAAILLQGLTGPITVNGKQYTPAAPMPGHKSIPGVTDQNLADVATFIRHAWDNRKRPVSTTTIAAVRQELADRDTVFTPEELEKTYR